MKNNEQNKSERIDELEIRLRHLSNQYDVINKQYNETTEEYYKIYEEITEANTRLKKEISERIKVEKELKKAHDELEMRIQERTTELAKANEDLQNDILERKKAEKSLYESEQRYHSTIDSFDVPIYMIDNKFVIIMHNNELERWHAKQQLTMDIDGNSIFELYPFLQNKVRDEYARVFERGELVVTEDEVKINDRCIIAETRKIPVINNGKIIGVITVQRDITERKEAEKALSESERKFRELADLLPETIWETDLFK